eukprot:2726409-Amphidinium_carterae.1
MDCMSKTLRLVQGVLVSDMHYVKAEPNCNSCKDVASTETICPAPVTLQRNGFLETVSELCCKTSPNLELYVRLKGLSLLLFLVVGSWLGLGNFRDRFQEDGEIPFCSAVTSCPLQCCRRLIWRKSLARMGPLRFCPTATSRIEDLKY